MSSRESYFPLIAGIIVHYRSPESLIRTVQSFENLRWPNKKLIIVDNDSGGESIARLRSQLHDVSLIESGRNGGYAAGMNRGIAEAQKLGAEYVWLLGQDITLEPDCLEILHDLWPRLQKPGFLGSLTDFNDTEEIYFFKASVDKDGRVRHRGENGSIRDFSELRSEYGTSDYVNGACLFTHRSVLDRVGPIPEEYFLYFEDVEWGLQSLRAGFQNYVSYRSRAHHHREVKARNWTAEYYCRRNQFLFKKRNGFLKRWAKERELLSLRWLKTRTRWKVLTKSEKSEHQKSVQVLKEVIRDLQNEKWGARAR